MEEEKVEAPVEAVGEVVDDSSEAVSEESSEAVSEEAAA